MKLKCMDKVTVLVDDVQKQAKVMRTGRKYAWLFIPEKPGLHKFSLETGRSAMSWSILSAGVEAKARQMRQEIRAALPSLSVEQLEKIREIVGA